MRRRDFIKGIAGAGVAWPLVARAQQHDAPRRIGVLMGFVEYDAEGQAQAAAFVQGLGALNWKEGSNLRIDWRWGDSDRTLMEHYAAELVALSPDLLLAGSSSIAVDVLRRRTGTIPIVFVSATDPVGQGFVESLAHPGGNVTGFSNYDPLMVSKWLGMLTQLTPPVANVAALYNPATTPYAPLLLHAIEEAAPSLAVAVRAAVVKDDAEIDAMMAGLAREERSGLLVLPDIFNNEHRDAIVALAARYRLPAVYPFHRFVTAGGLMSYGIESPELFRRSTTYVDRILKGAVPADLFRSILENATRICNANFGTLFRFDGENFYPVAQFNTPAALLEAQTRRGPFKPTPGTAIEHVMRTKQVSQSADKAAEPVPGFFAEHGGARTQVIVPMLKEGVLAGAITIYRQEVRPFTDKQIELVKNFAAQAVIAIENARLLKELRESLERQTATADILRVIAGTPEDSKRALDTIAETASLMFDVANVNFRRLEGNVLRIVSSAGPAVAKIREAPPDLPLEPTDPAVRAVFDNRQISFEDRRAVLVNERGEIARALRDLPVRSQAFTPLLRESKAIGVMIISRGEVRPFQEHELELMRGFADQAVIAIENARLLSELRQSLEQQTATADVLRVISSSPGELEPVFQTMLANAVRICDAKFGILWRYDNEAFDPVALFGAPEGLAEFVRQRGRFHPSAGTALDLILRTKDVVRISDAMTEPALATARRGGARSLIIVPMLKDDVLIGAITIYRQEVRPFTDKQVELIRNFAAQAVIAIENARLLDDLNKLNQQLEQRVTDQVGEIERMGRLRRFLPPQVADLIVASGTEKQLESHRREITALFCDLRGFTGFSESSDPEDVIALLRDYHAAIGQIIIKYSGTLERFAGDGVMVIFNDPVPVENPALQAVLMALDMRTAIGGMIEKWRDLGHDLGFGIGIAHGFAALGTIGFEGRFDYAAIGTVSNVASRLCDEAKPGQILISPRVRQAVDKAVTVEPVEEFTLKGIRRPMMTYNVLETSPAKPN